MIEMKHGITTLLNVICVFSSLVWIMIEMKHESTTLLSITCVFGFRLGGLSLKTGWKKIIVKIISVLVNKNVLKEIDGFWPLVAPSLGRYLYRTYSFD